MKRVKNKYAPGRFIICCLISAALLACWNSASAEEREDPAVGSEAMEPGQVTNFGAADPSVLQYERDLYLYATSGCDSGTALPIWRRGADDNAWKQVANVLEAKTPRHWIGACDFWAPEAHRVKDKFIIYFSARDQERRFCIAAAVANHPAGPFALEPSPVIRGIDCGVIDPHHFRDPLTDKSYLLWKEDRNDLRPREPTPIKLALMLENGLALKGEEYPKTILINDADWEGDVVEAPELIYRAPYYYLFYSGNAFFDDRYGIGVARAENIDGPYEKYDRNPILKSSGKIDGPGHPFLFYRAGNGDTKKNGGHLNNWIMFYHARIRGISEKMDPLNNRLLMAAHLEWDTDGWCSVIPAKDPI